MSNHLSIIRGTTKKITIEIVDSVGNPLDHCKLRGASAEFLMRNDPTDLTNVLRFTTTDTPGNLAFQPLASALDLTFNPTDTASLPLQLYHYQVMLTLSDGEVLPVIEWNLLDLNLGGAAVPVTPPFDNTVKLDHDYPLSDDMRYMTPGGSPINNAQIRVYQKSDYDAGLLTAPIGITTTNAYGRWIAPVLVKPGYSYVVRMEKPYDFGPDTRTVVVP